MNNKLQRHRPAEWFGFALEDTSEEAQRYRKNHWCPFLSEIEGAPQSCVKRTRLLPHPFGVCSVEFDPHGILALCPHRFLAEKKRVFRDIATHYFGSEHNLVVLAEIQVPKAGHLGRFDYVIVQHAPLSDQITDFVIVEFQSAQTTSTGKLVQAVEDYLSGGLKNLQQTYSFGINWADIWKRSLIQMLIKGMAVEHWGKAMYWVVQEQVYDNLSRRYGLPLPSQKREEPSQGRVRFALYDFEQQGNQFRLRKSQWLALSVEHIFQALRNNVPIPDLDQFQEYLQKTIKQISSHRLRWL